MHIYIYIYIDIIIYVYDVYIYIYLFIYLYMHISCSGSGRASWDPPARPPGRPPPGRLAEASVLPQRLHYDLPASSKLQLQKTNNDTGKHYTT